MADVAGREAARSVSGSGGERSSPRRKTRRCVPSSCAGVKRPGTTTRAGTVRRTSVCAWQGSGKFTLCTMTSVFHNFFIEFA